MTDLVQVVRRYEAALALKAEAYHRFAKREAGESLNREKPNPADYLELARLQTRLRNLEGAVAVLQDGLATCEPSEELYGEAVFVLQEANRTEEAIGLATRAKELLPDAGHLKLWEELMLPVLYDTESEIDQYRVRFSTGLNRVIEGLRLDTVEHRQFALRAISQHLNFYLGYQGHDDRELQEQYGQFVHRIVSANYPEWAKRLEMPPLSPGGKIRIGYISAHFRDHSVAKLFAGWITEHDPNKFEVFIYHNGSRDDAVTERVRRASDHFRHIPREFEELCQAVLSDRLHVAVFLDVRHRRMAMISGLRLAPVQCVAWAYPITSGSPNLDYYLSNELMEPENGHEHYSERLIRLPGIGVHYPKPVAPPLEMKRSDFGLDGDSVVFLCCQSTFKYLPQHDDLFPRIAKRVPKSQFVFLALNDVIGKVLLKRLQRAFAADGLDALEYCVILHQLETSDYWNLNLLSDVFLDSLEWSGGVTTLEAIACGVPIVTLPGKFMRGRHSYGILRQLGVTETIANDKQEYVDLAVRLGRDTDWRGHVVAKMRANSAKLYSDTECVLALEEFFRSIVKEHLENERSPQPTNACREQQPSPLAP
jgi:protein O-GlcNAc transferase